MSERDTIAAVATAPARGAVGMVRISGARAHAIAEQIVGSLPRARVASVRSFKDHQGQIIDSGLVLRFDAPHSFTGENVVELQGHGGPVVLQLLLDAVCQAGARRAKPGEFSERAFLNDRLDLAQAEAIADLIDASTRDAARAAVRSLDGEFSARVNNLAREILDLRVFVEGALDFSDEDIDWLSDDRLHQRVHELAQNLQNLLTAAGRGRRLRDGLTVTLTGQPNVGKSTLLNRLAGTDAAIVTDIPGTTRDILRENIEIDGMPITVIDTAGLRPSDDPVEQEGIRRAHNALNQAELALFLIDARAGFTDQDRALLTALPPALPVWIIHNKIDLSQKTQTQANPAGDAAREQHLHISAKAGHGIADLQQKLCAFAGLAHNSEGSFSARARHVQALQRCQKEVAQAQKRLQEKAHVELAAEDLRHAHDALGEITGKIKSDDLLGEIFSRFCIGK